MGERKVLLMVMMMMMVVIMVVVITILVAPHWCNTSNERGNLHHLKTICKTPVQHTEKA
jgi:heme/copper-type cytochrome/quinol oxidase subunit 2